MRLLVVAVLAFMNRGEIKAIPVVTLLRIECVTYFMDDPRSYLANGPSAAGRGGAARHDTTNNDPSCPATNKRVCVRARNKRVVSLIACH